MENETTAQQQEELDRIMEEQAKLAEKMNASKKKEPKLKGKVWDFFNIVRQSLRLSNLRTVQEGEVECQMRALRPGWFVQTMTIDLSIF